MKKLAVIMALALSLLAFSACSSDAGTSSADDGSTSSVAESSEPAGE